MAAGNYQTTVTIANAASLSGALAINDLHLVTIQMPAAWTTAALTFQGSVDGTNFFDIYDNAGYELTAPAGASRIIVFPFAYLGSLTHLKIRSGTTGSPVSQGADRVLNCRMRRYD